MSTVAPDESTIASIKAKFPGKSIYQISMKDDVGDEYYFLVTSPNKEEWKIYVNRTLAADKDMERVAASIEALALQHIRWPSREECIDLFMERPGVAMNFAPEFQKTVGAEIEVRTKKL